MGLVAKKNDFDGLGIWYHYMLDLPNNRIITFLVGDAF